MQTMAAKLGLSVMTASGHSNDYYRQTHSGDVIILREWDKAVPAKRGRKQEEDSLPESRWSWGVYLRVGRTPRGSNLYAARVLAHPVAGGRIEAQPRTEQAKPVPLLSREGSP